MSKSVQPSSESINSLKGRIFHYTEYGVSNLEGQILTIIDASFTDQEQRKAVKDLVKQTVWRWQWQFDENEENHNTGTNSLIRN
jgi:hypothetical protein